MTGSRLPVPPRLAEIVSPLIRATLDLVKDDTVSFSGTLRDVYERSGYTLVVVPNGSVEDRAAFIRMRVAR